jgi:hypothetical protein
VQRVLSEFYYLCKYRIDLRRHNWPQKLQVSYPQGLFNPTTSQLRAWVKSPYNLAHNRQAKQIAAPVDMQGPLREICLNRDTKWYYEIWTNSTGVKLPDLEAHINKSPEVRARALNLLETRFFFVGILERMEESRELLASLLGVDASQLAAQVHEQSGRPAMSEIPQDILDEIERRNELDRELYRAAQRLYLDVASA